MKSLQTFLNALPHWLVALAVAFGGGAYTFASELPASSALSVFSSLASAESFAKGAALAGLGAVILLAKQSWLTPPAAKAPGFITNAFLHVLAPCTLVFALSCALFSKVEPPAANFAVCVANDAAQDKALAQVVIDCGGDIVAVVESLFSSSDSGVKKSKTLAEAVKLKTVVASLPAPDAGSDAGDSGK